MEAIAKARFVKVPPRKARYIADLIRGKTVNQALSILMTVPRNSSRIIEKILDSAVANAIHKAEGERLDVDELVVTNVIVNEGPTTMRWRPRARGRATKIRHRTSHITVTVVNDEKTTGQGREE
ncbi:MAG: 50S ribosomal protein L22 [Candidatus Fermentibacteraceae bacterium]|nr:50S ribosomal protein L22 [Candidatus Fermentibacteraceae bacterium]